LDRRGRFADISTPGRWLILLALLLVTLLPAQAQLRLTTIELATTTEEGVLLHIRVPRGQTIADAALIQGDDEAAMDINSVQLPQTQWILVDASDAMINLQSVVQTSLDRFLRGSEAANGLIFFNSELQVLQPTEGNAEVADFLVRYTATAEQPACLAPALNELNEGIRSYDRSWRILLITAGDFSRQSTCPPADIPSLPAPVEVIVINDETDSSLQELVDRNGGQILTANLRTVEARINEVRTLWGQPTYSLAAELPAEWTTSRPISLRVSLSGGGEETVLLNLRNDYTRPIPPTPTPESTEVVLATIPPRDEDTGEDTGAIAEIATEAQGDLGAVNNDQIALLLIAGAGFFIVGAVILALALTRFRRTPDQISSSDAFYNTLDASPDDSNSFGSATKIGARDLLPEVDITRIADVAPRSVAPLTEEEELLVTKVLSDERVQSMMKQSLSDDEVLGIVRIEGTVEGDYELRRRGLLIGRSTDCDIQITGDAAISRHHARLEVDDEDNITISRLSATNPVIIGGVQVGNHHPLRPNDVIHLSDATRIIYIAKPNDDEEDE